MFRYALGGIVLLASTHSAALSLGGHSGQAVIGRALDMQVRSNASMAELEAAACLEAQVSYGDVALPSQAVSIQLQQGADGATIRVRANVPVNEPVVNVLLRAGCSGQVFSRRYVLLADIDTPSSPIAVAPQVPLVAAAPVVPVAPQAQPTPAPAPGPATSLPPVPPAPRAVAPSAPARPPAASPAPRTTAAPQVATPRAPQAATPAPAPAPRVAAPAPAPARAAAAPPAPPAASGPRLQLDPVDLTPQGAPTLRSSFDLQSTPTESEERRKAAQALWAALNAPPEQQMQDAQKLATLEQEVQGLRAEEQKLKATVETLQRELQQAREERTPGWLIGLLVAALLAALAAFAWLLRERRRAGVAAAAGSQPWWQSSQVAGAEGPGQALSDMAQGESGWAAPVVHGHDPEDSGVEVSEASESSFAVLHEEVPAEVDMLVDLNQHCEFFESLGQRPDAMAVLEDFVGRHPSASELPYLWLLRLSDEQGRDDERRRWSRRYEQVFGRAVPPPEAYDHAAPGLLEQERLLGDLQRLWPSAKAQELLRHAAFGRPGVGPMSQPTLNAYQDVLLLHTLAQSLPAEAELPAPVHAPVAKQPAPAPEVWPSVAPAAFADSSQLETEPTALDVDLSIPDAAPPPPLPDNAPPTAEPERRELPMLDFDLFDLEPGPAKGQGADTDKKA